MIGKKIKEIRKKRGLSQKKLGEIVGISESQISNIESDRKSTTIERQLKIADALGVHVSELYGDAYKQSTDNDWIMFNKSMEEQGISPEKAKRWIELARKFSEE